MWIDRTAFYQAFHDARSAGDISEAEHRAVLTSLNDISTIGPVKRMELKLEEAIPILEKHLPWFKVTKLFGESDYFPRWLSEAISVADNCHRCAEKK